MMMRNLLRIVLVGTALVTMGILLSGWFSLPEELGPPVGRLDESCFREGPESFELWCRDDQGIAHNLQTPDLTPGETRYLQRLERSRRGTERQFVPLDQVRDGRPDDEAPLFPHAEEPDPMPIGPLVAAVVGGLLVMGLMIGVFYAMGGFGSDDLDPEP